VCVCVCAYLSVVKADFSFHCAVIFIRCVGVGLCDISVCSRLVVEKIVLIKKKYGINTAGIGRGIR
jgi:Pyruvate/2-oxoacid:ferredoxin oxidoreductase delta subunit